MDEYKKTVISEQLKKFEEELKKTQEEINNIRNERMQQNKLYDRELNIKEKNLKDIQSVIDLVNIGTLENALPKYFKIKGRNSNIIAEVYKTREIIPEKERFTLLTDGIFCTHDDISDVSHIQFTTNNAIVLGYSLEEALNHISSYYEEITEEEYNDVKKIACEAIMKA